MEEATLVLVHGFWSSPATWDNLIARFAADSDLRGLVVHRFGYESPKLRLPLSWTRIPDYDDIAQSFVDDLAVHAPTGEIVIVTHSQGGLIVQRFLTWMLNEGRGRELARIKLIVMLASPNEGSEYGRSIRRAAGFGRHAQARDLKPLARDVATARRIVQKQIVGASHVSERECPIPIHAYAGRTDNIVRRESAQSAFSEVGTLPGNHFSIINPKIPGNITAHVLKDLIVRTFSGRDGSGFEISPAHLEPPQSRTQSKYSVNVQDSKNIMIGDEGIQHNY